MSPTSRSKTEQCTYIFFLGDRYLANSGRVAAVILLTLTTCYYNHPNPDLALRWRYYLATLCAAGGIGPYEILLIFPLNDVLSLEMGGELKKLKKENFGDRRDGELDRLLVKWCWLHSVRVLLTMTSTALLTWIGLELGDARF